MRPARGDCLGVKSSLEFCCFDSEIRMQGVTYASTGGPMMVPPAPGQTVVVVQTPRLYPRYKSRASVWLGVTQIVLAVLSMIFTALAIAFGDVLASVGSGIWCAVLYIIAGAFGIAARNKGRCMVITHLVMSIIAAAFTAIPFGIGLGSAVHIFKYRSCRSWQHDHDSCVQRGPGISQAIIVVLSLLEMITAVVAAVLSCQVVCGCTSSPAPEGEGMAQYIVTAGPSNQLLLQPANQAQAVAQPGPSVEDAMQHSPPPKYEEKEAPTN